MPSVFAAARGRTFAVQGAVRAVRQRWRRSQARPSSVLASVVAAIAPSRSASGQRTISMRSPGSASTSQSRRPVAAKHVHELVAVAGRRVKRQHLLPVVGIAADLLGELALGGLQRRLALDVELAGGQLERVLQQRLARLAHEPHVLVVVGDDRGRVLAADDLALDGLAVLVAEVLDADAELRTLERGAPAERLDALVGHASPSW